MTVAELKAYFYKGRMQPSSWPGMYPVYALCSDGGTLCPFCVTKNRERILRSTREQQSDGWQVVAVDVNWEDADLHCDNCNERIKSAYAEDEVVKP